MTDIDPPISFAAGQVSLAAITASEPSSINFGGITQGRGYINFTSRPITVINRTNIRCVVDNVPNINRGHFIIRDDYIVPAHQHEHLAHFFSSLKDTVSGSDLAHFIDSFRKQYEANRYGNVRVVIDTRISQSCMEEHRTLYIASKDIVISNQYITAEIEHPFSDEHLLYHRYKQIASHMESGITVSIELIDNDSVTSSRFIYLAKQVYQIRPHRDPTRPSGVYLSTTQIDRDGDRETISYRYGLEDAETELGLHRSKEEAIAGGDGKQINLVRMEELKTARAEFALREQQLKENLLAIESRLKEAEREFKLRELQSEEARRQSEAAHEATKKKIEMEIQGMKATHERDKLRYEKERAATEDYYSRRSHDRKDTSEMIKMIPVIIAAGLAIYVAVSKGGKS